MTRTETSETKTSADVVLKVVDALDHPHGNRILRTKVVAGVPPPVGDLKGSRLHAHGPEGEEVELRLIGFALFGGEPSDERIRSTGRMDLIVEGGSDVRSVDRTWKLHLA